MSGAEAAGDGAGVSGSAPTCCLEAVAWRSFQAAGTSGWLISRGCGEPAAEWGSSAAGLILGDPVLQAGDYPAAPPSAPPPGRIPSQQRFRCCARPFENCVVV